MSANIKDSLIEMLDCCADAETKEVLTSLTEKEADLINTQIQNHIKEIQIKPFPIVTLFKLNKTAIETFVYELKLILTIYGGARIN